MYTEFRRGKDYNVVCIYCEKTLIDLKEHWSFTLFFHPKIQEMIKKDLLICNCDFAKKDKELKLKIKECENLIKEYKEELGNLYFSVDPLPF